MTAHAGPANPAGDGGPALARRMYGFGSVFGKTLRDSRRATLIVGGILGFGLIAIAKSIVTEFATPTSRHELGDLIRSLPPILQGLAGRPVNVETLGGYVQYKYGAFFPLIASLWSILALSGTLATEARRGSLELVAAAPISRRRIALAKLGGHLVAVLLASTVVFLATAVAGSAFPTLPGDEISVTAALGYALWLGLMALVAGSVAFALAPFLGQGAAAGIAGAVLFAGFILNGYQAAIPALAPLANLTWFGWTANHLPLAGQFDWASLILVAGTAVVLLLIGVEAFARRDLGATSAIPTPRLPRALAGLHGPVGRSAAEGLPAAIAWGLGLGVFGLLIAGSGQSFADQIRKSPDLLRLFASIFPNLDFASTGGFLELLFIEFGLVLAGLAAATLVSGWASNETSGRLELLLAAPLARRRWVISSGVGLLACVAVVVALSAAGIALGAVLGGGGDLVTPVAGTLAVGLYAIALIGVGIGVGGLFGAGPAAAVVAVLTILTWFLDVIAPAFKLPADLRALALTAHYGLPMLGQWDVVGIVASVVLAVGGVAIGAWGFERRDLRA